MPFVSQRLMTLINIVYRLDCAQQPSAVGSRRRLNVAFSAVKIWRQNPRKSLAGSQTARCGAVIVFFSGRIVIGNGTSIPHSYHNRRLLRNASMGLLRYRAVKIYQRRRRFLNTDCITRAASQSPLLLTDRQSETGAICRILEHVV